jgi:hypothetical protein
MKNNFSLDLLKNRAVRLASTAEKTWLRPPTEGKH